MARKRTPKDKRSRAKGQASSTPHDHLVRHVFATPEVIAGELRSILPKALVEALDWRTLKREPGTFVDKDGESRTDLLFSARVRSSEQRLYVYLLFEHQSEPHPDMPMRMLVYTGRAWMEMRARAARHSEGRRAKVPPIVPVVLHHGAQGWTEAKSLGELIEWDDALRAKVGRFVPDFELLIDDLAKVTESELRSRNMPWEGVLVLAALRVVRLGFDPAELTHWVTVVSEAAEHAPKEAFMHILRYLTKSELGSSWMDALSEQPLSETARRDIMTLQQKWLEEGRHEGRQEGHANVLLKLLRRRFSSVDAQIEMRIRKAELDALERWTDRVLSADSIDDVFEGESFKD